MTPPRQPRERVIMFADIVGSTRIYESLGDAAANRLIRDRLRLLADTAEQHDGEVVAEIGDEIMAFFDSTDNAAAAACEMHVNLNERDTETQEMPISVRLGLNMGEVQGGTEDLIGEPAKMAQWAAKNAKPDQTLITRNVYESLPRLYKAVSRFVDDETWNLDSREHMEIFELIWDVEAVTAYKDEEQPKPGDRIKEIRLEIDGKTYLLNAERPVISVGRDPRNDICITHDLVSRQHFSAQFSRGRASITDNSTNGTYIISAADDTIPVRRETFPLRGSGRIYLGEPSESKDDYAIHFSCE